MHFFTYRDIANEFEFKATERIKLIKGLRLLPNAAINKEKKPKVVTVVVGAEEQKIMDKLLQKNEINTYNVQQLQNGIKGIVYF